MGLTANGAAVRHRPVHHRRPSGWPFKAQPPEPACVSEFGVGVPRRQEVEFADGSRIWLLRVERDGVPDLFARDLHRMHQEPVRVDLRNLVPEIEKDLPIASSRDVPGIVHFSLRGKFQSVKELLEAAAAKGGGRP